MDVNEYSRELKKTISEFPREIVDDFTVALSMSLLRLETTYLLSLGKTRDEVNRHLIMEMVGSLKILKEFSTNSNIQGELDKLISDVEKGNQNRD